MVRLAKSFTRLKPIRAIVLGDFMLDTYTKGSVNRISPEAPVPVLHVSEKESRPGGAGNVALNLLSLGAEVLPFGRVGNDAEGIYLTRLMEEEGLDTSGMVIQRKYPTAVKNRLIAGSQQIVRVDQENCQPLAKNLEAELLQRLTKIISDVQILAISDYNKGFFSRSFLQKIIMLANENGVLTAVDPKGEDFSKYFGATLIKPNEREAYLAAKAGHGISIDQVAKKLLAVSGAENLLITRSEKGMSLFGHYRQDFSVASKEVKDVTGAGDTVLAMMTVGLANQIPLVDAVQMANIAGSMVVERIGCVRVFLSEIAERLLHFDTENKIFSESHLHVLKEALKDKQFYIIGINAEKLLLPSFHQRLLHLRKANPKAKILVYLESKDEKIISLFSALSAVDFVVLGTAGLMNLHEMIHAKELFMAEGDQMKAVESLESLA